MKKLLLMLVVVVVGLVGCEFTNYIEPDKSITYRVNSYLSGNYTVEYVDNTGSHIQIMSEDFYYTFDYGEEYGPIYLDVYNSSEAILFMYVEYSDSKIVKSVKSGELEYIEILF